MSGIFEVRESFGPRGEHTVDRREYSHEELMNARNRAREIKQLQDQVYGLDHEARSLRNKLAGCITPEKHASEVQAARKDLQEQIEALKQKNTEYLSDVRHAKAALELALLAGPTDNTVNIEETYWRTISDEAIEARRYKRFWWCPPVLLGVWDWIKGLRRN